MYWSAFYPLAVLGGQLWRPRRKSSLWFIDFVSLWLMNFRVWIWSCTEKRKIHQGGENKNKHQSSSHQVCQKKSKASSFICRLIKSEYSTVKNGGVLCRNKNLNYVKFALFQSLKLTWYLSLVYLFSMRRKLNYLISGLKK